MSQKTRMVGFVSLLLVAACGTTEGTQLVDGNAGVSIVATGPEAEVTVTSAIGGDAGNRATEWPFWDRYKGLYESRLEPYPASSLADQYAKADLVVRGRIVDVSEGPRTAGPPSLWPILQRVTVHIGANSSATYEFDMPMIATSPELLAAIDAARNKEAIAEAQRTGKDPVNAVDQAAVDAAYQKYFAGAIAYTLNDLRGKLPQNEALFFLKKSPTRTGLLNSTSVVINSNGVARFAAVAEDHVAAQLWSDVNGRPFDEVANRR